MIQSILLPNGQSWEFEYNDSNGLSPTDPNYVNYASLTKITFPSGGTISYTWGTIGTGDTTSTRRVLSRTVNANDGTGLQAWTYTYRGTPFAGPYPFTNTVSDPVGNYTDHVFTNMNGSNSVFETQLNVFDKSTGNPILLKTVNTDYQWISPTIGTTDCTAGASGTAAQDVVPIRVTTVWPNGKTTKVESDYDAGFTYLDMTPGSTLRNQGTYGKVLTKREYDYGPGAAGALLRKTVTTYLGLTNSNYLTIDGVGLPTSVATYDGGSTLKAYTTYTYDGSTLNSSGITTQRDTSPPNGSYRGNQTSVSRWLNTNSTYLTSTATFYDTGMPYQITDPGLHTKTLSYSSAFAGAYPTQTQLPDTNSPNLAHHSVSGNYDFNTGLLTSFTDQNSNTTTYTWDSSWRISQITYPQQPQPGGTNGQTSFNYPDAQTVEILKKMDSNRSTDGFVRVDGLGREIRRITANDEATPWDQADTCYDVLGRVSFRSYPYQGTGLSMSQVCSGAGDSFAHDALGRTTTVTHSDGSTVSTSYAGAAVSVSDEGNGTRRVQRISQSDGLGRLTNLCEVTSVTLIGTTPTPASCGLDISGTGFLTSYGYDTLGNLASVTQGGLQARSFAYDSLSRLTSATNPESGTMTYGYDNDGLLLTKVAPKPNQTGTATVTATMSYDPLHRLRTKSYSDNATNPAVFDYDEPSALGVTLTNAIGRASSHCVKNIVGVPLSPASCTNGAQEALLSGEVDSYDTMGRVLDNSQCTPQNCASGKFSIQYTYDLLSDMTSGTNGLGVALTDAYNRAQRLTALTSSLSDANHPANLLSAAHFNPAGSLLTANFGNGIGETRTYDARLRLLTITDGSAYSLSIPGSGGYAPNSDILAANDSANGNWTYTYDDFNRLLGANQNNGAAVYSYDYDRFGNRWHQNGPHSMMLSFSGNNNRMDGYSYDAAGNLLNDGTTTYTYDAENRIITASNSQSGASSYMYDANGQRLRKTTVAGGTVDFLYDLAGHQVSEVSSAGAWNRGEIYAGGRHIATYKGGASGMTYFIHADWLGTERARTTAAGAAYETCTSLPFGDALNCVGSTDPSPMHFTGKERDGESSLDYFGARYYASWLGRFSTPDGPLADHDPSYSQSWNLYGYVRGNPLRSVDPTGRGAKEFWEAFKNILVVKVSTTTGSSVHGTALGMKLSTSSGITTESKIHPLGNEKSETTTNMEQNVKVQLGPGSVTVGTKTPLIDPNTGAVYPHTETQASGKVGVETGEAATAGVISGTNEHEIPLIGVGIDVEGFGGGTDLSLDTGALSTAGSEFPDALLEGIGALVQMGAGLNPFQSETPNPPLTDPTKPLTDPPK